MALLFPTSKKKGGQVLQGAADGFLEAAFPKTMANIKRIRNAVAGRKKQSPESPKTENLRGEYESNRKPPFNSKKLPYNNDEQKKASKLLGVDINGVWEPGDGGHSNVASKDYKKISKPPMEARRQDDEKRKASKLLGVNLIGGGK